MSQKQIVQSYFENRPKVNGQKLLGKEEMSQKEMQLESFWERVNVAKGNVEEQMAQEQMSYNQMVTSWASNKMAATSTKTKNRNALHTELHSGTRCPCPKHEKSFSFLRYLFLKVVPEVKKNLRISEKAHQKLCPLRSFSII